MSSTELEQQLSEKEELVAALTEQLEQAAEQLDRMQRSGGLLAPHRASTNDEYSEQVAQDVGYLVEQWDTAQMPGSLGRIEMQIEELRDLVVRFTNTPPTIYNQPETRYVEENPDRPSEDELFDTLADVLLDSSGQIPDEEISEESFGTPRSHHSEVSDAVPDGLPVPPAEVDLEQADRSQLVTAIQERDVYIETCLLLYRDVRRNAGLLGAVDWESLNEYPEELRKQLESLEEHLEEQSRVNEITLSLERARLSREATRLNQVRMQVEKHAKKHGIDLIELEDAGIVSEKVRESERERVSGGQKWLTMLRLKDVRDK
ncbi:hypothetical protein [Rubinisphaera margarita]|uniref:hypothetical protein n=1 Tax=Rubinisphaera margarita TaxID=2909586 RepID=UPI001EE84000|nr:hypothetical protein [Rubinisphaera margarita]MCG6155814.1 hypothetical protein [Rubinisphaera margarita]